MNKVIFKKKINGSFPKKHSEKNGSRRAVLFFRNYITMVLKHTVFFSSFWRNLYHNDIILEQKNRTDSWTEEQNWFFNWLFNWFFNWFFNVRCSDNWQLSSLLYRCYIVVISLLYISLLYRYSLLNHYSGVLLLFLGFFKQTNKQKNTSLCFWTVVSCSLLYSW